MPDEDLRQKELKEDANYKDWISAGHIITSPGPLILWEQVIDYIKDLMRSDNVQGMAYDHYGFGQFLEKLDDHGVPYTDVPGKANKDVLLVVPHGQGVAGGVAASEQVMKEKKQPGKKRRVSPRLWMPESITNFEEDILHQNIEFEQNPVLTWAVFAAQLEDDGRSNRTFAKGQLKGKIDALLASVMSHGLALKMRRRRGGSTLLEALINQPRGKGKKAKVA